MTNKSNQTALDIATFWGYRDIANLLANVKGGLEPFFLGNEVREHENYFCRTFLDRKSEKRVDSNWLSMKQKEPTTVYILFTKLSPLATSDDGGNSSQNPKVKLHRLYYKDIKEYLEHPETITLVFLGLEIPMKSDFLPTQNQNDPNEDEYNGLAAWFALSLDTPAAERFIQEHQGCYFLQPPMPALLQFSENEAGKGPKHSHLSLC